MALTRPTQLGCPTLDDLPSSLQSSLKSHTMCIFCLRVQLSLNQCNVWLRPSLEEIIKWVDCCLNFYCSTFDPAKINSMGRSSCLLNQLVLINCMGIHSKATLSKTRSLLSNKLEDLDGMGFLPREETKGEIL